LTAFPGPGDIRTRQVAILVADGVDADAVRVLQSALVGQGAVPRLVGIRIGPVEAANGEPLDADASMENSPSVLFDGVVLPDGTQAVDRLAAVGQTAEFIKDSYRHCKTLLALGASRRLLAQAGVPSKLPSGEPDPGIVAASVDSLDQAVGWFVQALGRHRHLVRETDPPVV
jgi:catalase